MLVVLSEINIFELSVDVKSTLSCFLNEISISAVTHAREINI